MVCEKRTFSVNFLTVPVTVLTQVGDGVCVDVCWEGLLPLDIGVGNPMVLQSESLQLPWLTGQLPVHLHGRLVQDLSEETGRTGNCGTDRDRYGLWSHGKHL